MNDDRGYAMPKLYGAPAYARPPVVPVAPADRPFDPDDLPLESERTSEERDLLAQLEPRSSDAPAMGGATATEASPDGPADGRSFRLRLPGRR